MEKTRSPLLYINVYTVKMHRMKKIYMKKEMEKTRTKIKDKQKERKKSQNSENNDETYIFEISAKF